ncbi:E3 ubiquitin-protein like [Heracleum sosnowskyi]|uniref:E3 ubiquitin-protein like n=1 Tax=Heracleum sosnowskyi TaxID=360622 RepID=A0AAD8M022_9APIA|nr:E3 ubiquitin-protein like [Heracleum sosnowskyi]
MTCFGSECGCGCCSSMVTNDDIICFSEVEEGSSYSLSSSTTDSSNHGHNIDSEVVHSGRMSSVVCSDCRVDIGNGVDQVETFSRMTERDCRICYSSLDLESGIAIELGCSCKNELAAVHQHCAKTWFSIKGNKICEICNSIAQNIVGMNIIESRQPISAVGTSSTDEVSVQIIETAISMPLSVQIIETAISMPLSRTPHTGAGGRLASRLCLITLVLIICFFVFLMIFNKVHGSRNRH